MPKINPRSLDPLGRLLTGAIEGPIVSPELGPCLDFRHPPSLQRRYIQVHMQGRLIQGTRLVLEHALGRPLGPGMCALHRCDRPRCLRESHLYEGTMKQNAKDRDSRTGNGALKFTVDVVRAMKHAAASGVVRKNIIEQYGVSAGHLSQILSGQVRVL